VRGTNVKITDALRILEEISLKHKGTVIPATFIPGEGTFFALLSTPNFKPIAYMLRDHYNNLGWKAISSCARLDLSCEAKRFRRSLRAAEAERPFEASRRDVYKVFRAACSDLKNQRDVFSIRL
jgi:hypothetical protein